MPTIMAAFHSETVLIVAAAEDPHDIRAAQLRNSGAFTARMRYCVDVSSSCPKFPAIKTRQSNKQSNSSRQILIRRRESYGINLFRPPQSSSHKYIVQAYTDNKDIGEQVMLPNQELENLNVECDAAERQVYSQSASPLENTMKSTVAVEKGGGRIEEDIFQEGLRLQRVCDRLIEVFLVDKPNPSDWRKLLAFSEEWPNIRPWFFDRCKTRAEVEEDFGKKGDILKLARKLKEVDDDITRHSKLFRELEKDPLQIDMLVTKRRKDFTTDFFEYLGTIYGASFKEHHRQHEVAELAMKVFASVQAYDKLAQDENALTSAQLKLNDILSSPSLATACEKIDQLARKQELDSTLMLLITKAWASTKESAATKEEVKDIMYHLYMVARGNLQRLVPKEVRIIRHLLSIQDPKEQFAALTDAFSPGEELEGDQIDLLDSTPEKLHVWMKTILDAYYSGKHGTLVKEAQKLLSPHIIKKLESLKKVVEKQFM